MRQIPSLEWTPCGSETAVAVGCCVVELTVVHYCMLLLFIPAR